MNDNLNTEQLSEDAIFPSFNDKEFKPNEYGLFSLDDIFKYSKLDRHFKPRQWLKLKPIQELVINSIITDQYSIPPDFVTTQSKPSDEIFATRSIVSRYIKWLESGCSRHCLAKPKVADEASTQEKDNKEMETKDKGEIPTKGFEEKPTFGKGLLFGVKIPTKKEKPNLATELKNLTALTEWESKKNIGKRELFGFEHLEVKQVFNLICEGVSQKEALLKYLESDLKILTKSIETVKISSTQELIEVLNIIKESKDIYRGLISNLIIDQSSKELNTAGEKVFSLTETLRELSANKGRGKIMPRSKNKEISVFATPPKHNSELCDLFGSRFEIPSGWYSPTHIMQLLPNWANAWVTITTIGSVSTMLGMKDRQGKWAEHVQEYTTDVDNVPSVTCYRYSPLAVKHILTTAADKGLLKIYS